MSNKIIASISSKYKDAVACAECIESVVSSAVNSGTLLDIQLVSTFYDRLLLCLHSAALCSSSQTPHFSSSVASLISQCGRQQRKIGKLVLKANRDKTTVASLKTSENDESGALETNNGGSDANGELFTAVHSDLVFEDVAGLNDAKQALFEAAILPLKFPQIFTGGRSSWRRVLLYGPPGTGKSRLVEALAGEMRAPLVTLTADHVLSAYVGQSERRLTSVFESANSALGRGGPDGRMTVLFIDELDGVCRRRDSSEHEHSRRLKTHLLQLIDRIGAHSRRRKLCDSDSDGQYKNLLLLAATNCPWDLDAAFVRRFQRRIYVPLPDRDTRRGVIELHLSGSPVDLTEHQWCQLLDLTDGFSGSDLSNVVQHALYGPVHHLITATHWRLVHTDCYMPCSDTTAGAFAATVADINPHKVVPRNVQFEDLMRAVSKVRPSVTEELINKYHVFNAD